LGGGKTNANERGVSLWNLLGSITMSHHGKHQHSQFQSQPGRQESPEALAYQLWDEAGRPEGQAARFWREAEERIKRLRQPAAASLYQDRGRQENAL
jgi:hypothetical protein